MEKLNYNIELLVFIVGFILVWIFYFIDSYIADMITNLGYVMIGIGVYGVYLKSKLNKR